MGIQHLRSTLAFDIDVQLWHSTLTFNIGIQPRHPTSTFNNPEATQIGALTFWVRTPQCDVCGPGEERVAQIAATHASTVVVLLGVFGDAINDSCLVAS